jgi:hypothetical protein
VGGGLLEVPKLCADHGHSDLHARKQSWRCSLVSCIPCDEAWDAMSRLLSAAMHDGQIAVEEYVDNLSADRPGIDPADSRKR